MIRRRRRRILLALLAAGLILLGWPLPQELARPRQEGSVTLLDRNGQTLRVVTSSRNGVGRWVDLDRVAPVAVQATLLAEDRRFWYHPGLDPAAMLRSLWINLRAGRILTGGSTLTQQLARSLRPPRPRGLASKTLEAWDAVRLEVHFSKREILEAWLNRVYFGNGAYGLEAASWRYFQRPSAHLSAAQAATLAILPRAPEALDPVGRPEAVLPLRQALLRRMGEEGLLVGEDLRLALDEPLVVAPLEERFAAPHFCDMVLADLPAVAGVERVQTTLDLPLQRLAEDLLEAHLRRVAGQAVGNGAVVILEVATGDVLAMVGSRDYFDPRAGQVNGALALRSPGSTLKPFMYELALERGYTSASLLPDVAHLPGGTLDGYLPRNYDWTCHGPVRLRTALACSYNLAAVRTLQALGPASFLERLRHLGFTCLARSAGHYGTGLTLGDGEVALLDLARAYRALARGGRLGPLRACRALERAGRWTPVPVGADRAIMDPAACFVVSDILADDEARAPAFGRHGPLALPFPCAVKTGTSKDYRDNWTVGYTPRYVVGVWVGNFDGRSMIGASGVTGAGPLFRDLMLALRERDRLRQSPRGLEPDFQAPGRLRRVGVCPVSGELPGPDCPGALEEYFLSGTVPTARCSVHRRVVLDRRSGRRAGPATPPGHRVERVFEVYPPLYRSWMADVGLPMPPDGPPSRSAAWASRPRVPVAVADAESSSADARLRPPEAPGRLAIANPEDEATFRIDPVLRRDYQEVVLRAVVPEGVGRVEWRVDGRLLATRSFPFTCRWRLEPGRHTLTLDATGQPRAAVTVTVLE